MRKYTGTMAWVVEGIGIIVALYHLLFIGGILDKMGIHMYLLSYRAGSLAGLMLLVYLLYPATKKGLKKGLGWTDIVLMIMGVGPCVYLLLFTDQIIANHTQFDYLPALIATIPLIIAILEASRRTVDKAIVIIAILFFCYPLFQSYVPGVLGGRSFEISRFCSYLYTSLDNGIFGVAYGAAASIIITYVIFSQFLLATGAGKFFLNLALSLFGHVRGGTAKVAVVSSALFGTITGSVSANVAACGTVTIPMMKSAGYKAHFAGAVESIASNGGQIMPPVMGMVVFIMADLTGIDYWKICIASIIPAFLYYLALFVQVDLEAAKSGIKGLPKEQIPSFIKTFKDGWFYFLPLVVLVVLLVVFKYPVELAGLYSILAVILVTLFFKEARLSPKKIGDSLYEGTRSFVMPAIVCALVGIIIGAVMQTGMGVKLSGVLIEIAHGNLYILLILTAVACYILGMGLSSIPLYIMMVVLTAPALLKMGVDVMPAHLFVLWFGLTSFITPPVAIAVFVACAISGASTWKTGWCAMKLGIGTYIIPFLFVMRPELLLLGNSDVIQTILACLLSIVGIAAVSIGVTGYFLKSTHWVKRVAFIISGLLLCVPIMIVNLIAIALLIILVAEQIITRQRVKVLSAGNS